jgi:exopolysaccharide production protein ExoZ
VITTSARYSSIQIARAFAALAVVMTHSQVLPELLGMQPDNTDFWSFGQAGVDIFFMISGFIISAVIEKPQTAGHFVARRAFRILPFYWLFTATALLLLAIGSGALPNAAELARSFAVIPQDANPVLAVGWSLEHELVFYAIVAVLVHCGRADALFSVMASLSLASIAAHILVPAAVDRGFGSHILSLYHIQFFAGVALFRWQHRLETLPWLRLLLIGALLFPLTAGLLHLIYYAPIPQQPVGALGLARIVLWGIAGGFVLTGLLAVEKQRPDLLLTKPARLLILTGGASYALYLSHPVIIDILGVCLQGYWSAGWSPQLAQVIAIAASLGFAVAFYRWIEAPLIGRLSGFADAVSSRKAPQAWKAKRSSSARSG